MAVGLDYAAFWDLTFREVMMILDAKREQREADFDRARWLNHEAAALTSFAYHAPKKMPKFKPTKAKDDKADEAVAQELVRGHFIGLALQASKKKA